MLQPLASEGREQENAYDDQVSAASLLQAIGNPLHLEPVDNDIALAPLEDTAENLSARSDDGLIIRAREPSLDPATDPNTVGRLRIKILIWRLTNSLMLLYLIPATVCLLYATIRDFPFECDRPLRAWALVQSTIQSLMIVLHLACLSNLPKPSVLAADQPIPMRRTYWLHVANRLIAFCWYGWWVFGCIWILEVHTRGSSCADAKHLRLVVLICVIAQASLLTFITCTCFCGCLLLLLRVVLSAFLPAPGFVSGAPQHLIDALPKTVYRKPTLSTAKDSAEPNKETEDDGTNLCGICLEAYADGDELRHLPCKHHFHLRCVDKWLSIRKSCPFCTRPIDSSMPTTPTAAASRTSSSNSSSTSSSSSVPPQLDAV